MVDDNVTGLTSGLSTDNTFHGDNFSDMGLLGFEELHGDTRLVPVRFCLQEVLAFRSLGTSCCVKRGTVY
jgi:hypothetical protein